MRSVVILLFTALIGFAMVGSASWGSADHHEGCADCVTTADDPQPEGSHARACAGPAHCFPAAPVDLATVAGPGGLSDLSLGPLAAPGIRTAPRQPDTPPPRV